MNETVEARILLEGDHTLLLGGAWTSLQLGRIDAFLRANRTPPTITTVDARDMSQVDSAGAYLLLLLLADAGLRWDRLSIRGLAPAHRKIIDEVRACPVMAPPAPLSRRRDPISGAGARVIELAAQTVSQIAYIGELAGMLGRLTSGRAKWRLTTLMHQIQRMGPAALPLIGLLSFLIGIVIAYQGAVQLRRFGADIFIVDLVCLTTLRELGPLLASIIVAGRTGAAVAAEIATMQVTRELDALRVLGLSPAEVVVFPRVLALVVSLPLLAVVADVSAVAGSMLMVSLTTDVTVSAFIDRIPQAVALDSFLVGVGKTPVFAVIIGVVSSWQGMQARQDAASVGYRTTMSVVQSIFFIIVADAGFSMVFTMLDI